MEFTFYQLLWMFFIYAFIGWCCEVAFAAVRHGKFVNRGFLNGPVCPIYGFGVVLVIVCLTPVADSLPLLFLGSLVLTTVIEFFTGWILEKLFHAKWWDYSKMRFNLKGYVCLEFSILWGLGATAVLRLVAPPIEALINWLPQVLGLVLLAVLSALILADLAATIAEVRKLQSRVQLLSELAGSIHGVSDALGEGISGVALDAREDVVLYAPLKELTEAHLAEEKALSSAHRAQEAALLEQLRSQQKDLHEDRRDESRQKHAQSLAEFQKKLQEKSPGSNRLLRAFPDLKLHDHQDMLERLKHKLNGGGDDDAA